GRRQSPARRAQTNRARSRVCGSAASRRCRSRCRRSSYPRFPPCPAVMVLDSGATTGTPYLFPRAYVFVGDVERAVDDGETAHQILLRDDEWRRDVRPVEVHERPHAALPARRGECAHRCRIRAGGVVRAERLARVTVTDESDGPAEAHAARLADGGVRAGELLEAGGDDARTEIAHALEDAVALEHLEGRDTGGAREGMA